MEAPREFPSSVLHSIANDGIALTRKTLEALGYKLPPVPALGATTFLRSEQARSFISPALFPQA